MMINTEEFQSLKIGCCRTPIRGSKYCALHQEQDSSELTCSSSIGEQRHHRLSRLQGSNWRWRKLMGLNATSCRTQKSKPESYVDRCSRSFGVIAGVTNCKIIVTFSELFRSETLRKILSLLFSTIRGMNHELKLLNTCKVW